MMQDTGQPTYWEATGNAFVAFLLVAVMAGTVPGLISGRAGIAAFGALAFLVGGGMTGIIVAPVAAALWQVTRQLTGDGILACLGFGAFTGCALALIVTQQGIAVGAMALGGGLGTAGGLFYWFLMRRTERSNAAAAPRLIEEVFK